tara:strand:- start:4475 stop:4945 length:471 start_codon:yes stop_codon:yes gene_type:complete
MDQEWLRRVEKKAYNLIISRKYRPFKNHLPFHENDFRIYVRNFSDNFLIKCFPYINPLDMPSYIDNLLLYKKYNVINEIYRNHGKVFLVLFQLMWFPYDDLLKCDLQILSHMLNTKDRKELNNNMLLIKNGINNFIFIYEKVNLPKIIHDKILYYF